MKKTLAVALASSATLGIASYASADWVIDIDDFSVGNAGSGFDATYVHTANLGAGADISGMSVSVGSWTTVGGAFGSDILMTVNDPDGGTTTFGGYDQEGTVDNFWLNSNPGTDWTGEDSWDNAFGNGVTRPGEWTFTFSYDWAGGTTAGATWEDVQITLHKVPAPGALALLGVAGLCGTSRRRRA